MFSEKKQSNIVKKNSKNQKLTQSNRLSFLNYLPSNDHARLKSNDHMVCNRSRNHHNSVLKHLLSHSSFIVLVPLLISLCLSTTQAYSSCPNSCSGHGTCALPTTTGSTGASNLATTLGLCTCDAGYTHPDCSGRPCPTGLSWFDAATANGIAHRTGVECSDAGLCLSESGTCKCYEGYTGDACQRQDCTAAGDKQCSGHGRCRTMQYIAENYGPPATTSAKLAIGPVYANWEAQLYSACYCDWGSTGSMCQLKSCPKGDDPRTTSGQNDFKFTITTSGTSGTALAGYFTFHFYGLTTQFKADAYSPTFSNANCKTFVEALANVATATCIVSSISNNHRGATYTITITKYPTISYENNFFYHTGSPSIDNMGCSIDDLTAGASPVCAIAVTRAGTKEYAYCSNRGYCDLPTGTCACHRNFYGEACGNEGTLFQIDDAATALTLTAESSVYTGTLLQMKVNRAASSNFKFVDMLANGASKFSIDGQGELVMSGITLDKTGVTTTDGGASITKATNADTLSVTASQTEFTEDVLALSSTKAAASNFKALHFIAGSGGTTIFSVAGDGAIVTTNNVQSTSPTTGSIKTVGGMGVGKAVYVGGIIVTHDTTEAVMGSVGSVVVPTAGSIITSGGMGIAKRLTATQLEVHSSAKLSPTTASAYFRNSHLSFTGNVLLVESSMQAGGSNYNLIQANINKDGTKALKFEVDGSGYVTAAGGANIVSGGLTIAAGGATVAAGGLTVSAGSIALSSTAAQTIAHTGSSGNGLTISSGGGVTLSGAVIFGASGCNCASSGGLDLKNAIPMRFDGATEDNYWLNLAVGNGPTGSSKTLTLPVGESGTLLTHVSTGPSALTSVGVLTGLTVTSTVALSTTTGAATVKNSKTSNFVGNLLQLDTAMATASNAYNIILARTNTAGTAVTKFKVDGTGKVTAAGGAVFGGTGMSLASGDMTMTSSGAQAITHTGGGSNGLTISSGGGVSMPGANTFGSTNHGVTIKNNIPIQFEGEVEDGKVLNINVGNGPTGSSKTLTLPVDATATVVASASTLAVTIQSTNSVTLEAAKFTDNVVTHKDSNSFLSIENVKFEDGAASAMTTLGMTSHLTNSGGDILFTGSATQDITKSGGGDLIISSSHSSGTVYTHVEGWKFDAGAVVSASHITIDAASVRLEKLKCTENVCENSVGGTNVNNYIAIEVVRFLNGAMSEATTIGMTSHLTNSGGDFYFTGSAAQDITKSGGGDLIISSSHTSGTVYTHVEDWKFDGGAVVSGSHLSMDGASTTIEKFKCTENVCEHGSGDGGSNYIQIEVVRFYNGAITAVTALTMSGDLTNTAGNFLFTKSGNQLITKSGSGNLLISGGAAVCVESWCFTAGAAASSSAHFTIDGASTTIEKFKCTENVCEHGSGDGGANFIQIEVVKFYNGAISAVTDLSMSGDMTNTAGDFLFTASGNQLITKSGGDLLITGSAAVCVESWCFTAGAAASSSAHLSIDGLSASIEKFKCTGANCINKDAGVGDYITIEDVKFLNGAVSQVVSVGMSGDLTNSAGDILFTNAGNQRITKSGGGDLIISSSNGATTVYTHVEDWKFNGGAVTSTSHLTIDAASTSIEKLKCVENVCENLDGAGSSNFISLEVVRFNDGAISAATSLSMSAALTNSGGDLLFTAGGAQKITKSGSGDLVISSSVSGGGVIVESFKFVDGAIVGVAGSTDLSIDAASTTIENMKCAASVCEHKSGAGNALSLEDVSYMDGAMTGKSMTLDPNSASGGAITVTNTATQTSGTLVTVTGLAGKNALSIPTGNVNFGNGKFVVNQNGVETFGVNVCAVSITSASGAQVPSGACNTVAGQITVVIPSTGGVYPIAPGRCGDNLNFRNTKIPSSSSVVLMTLTSFSGMSATNAISAGVPYVLTGSVSSGAIQFFICNVGATPLTGTVKVKFIVAGG